MTILAIATLAIIIAQQGQDTTYARLIREATTDERFLPASVATIPLNDAIPSPLNFFGTIAGAEGVTHRSAEIYAYMRAVADASPRVTVEVVGTTEGGREIIQVVFADEATIGDLDRVKANVAALADPRSTSREQMEELVQNAKPVYYLQAGLHSPEMGSPEMVMELAYRLATSDDPTIERIRNNVVTVLNPVAEPDGRDRQVDWYYRYTRGRENYRDGFPRSPPYWGEYTYHDNNRDGLQITQAITQAIYDIHTEWHPTASLDLHESVPLLYVSTGTGPYNRTIDPITISEWQTMSNWDVQALTSQGAPGVWTWGFYNGWWPGYALWIANNHNGVGRFYETFGNAGADTYVRDLRGGTYAGDSITTRQWYRPWPPTEKVRWSLRNNTNYMQAGVIAALDYASLNGQQMLRNFWQKGRNSIDRGINETPHAFHIPSFVEQRDPRRAAYLVNQLMRHGIEVHESTDSMPGYMVLLNQPYRDFAYDLLSKQEFPSNSKYRPYDDVAWTLGLLYGVDVHEVDDATVFEWPGMTRVTEPVAFNRTPDAEQTGADRSTWLLRYSAEAELAPALYALKDRDRRVRIFAAETEFEASDEAWNAGTVILENLRGRDAAWVTETYGLFLMRSDPAEISRHELDLPRIAVYHTWRETQAEGWVRYWFEQLGIPYTSIHKDDVRSGRLHRRFDVILIPHAFGNAAEFVHGQDTRFGPMPYTATSEFPSHGTPSSTDDMTGGPGFEGMIEFENFLDNGGTIVTLGNSARLVAETGLTRTLSSYSASGLAHPGSVVRAMARQPDHPFMYGYPDTTHIFRGNFPLWRTALRDRGTIVLQYGTKPLADEVETTGDMLGMPDEPEPTPAERDGDDEDSDMEGEDESPEDKPYVLSGDVRGSDSIIGHGAIFDLPAGAGDAGRIVVFSFNPCIGT